MLSHDRFALELSSSGAGTIPALASAVPSTLTSLEGEEASQPASKVVTPQPQPKTPPHIPRNASCNLLVCNLPQSFRDKDLGALCGRFGQVVRPKVMIDTERNLSLCRGFVLMKDLTEAIAAKKALDGYQLPGYTDHVISCMYSNLDTSHLMKPSNFVLIRNVPKSVTESQVRAECEKYGAVAEVKLQYQTNHYFTANVTFVEAGKPAVACEEALHSVGNIFDTAAPDLLVKVGEEKSARQERKRGERSSAASPQHYTPHDQQPQQQQQQPRAQQPQANSAQSPTLPMSQPQQLPANPMLFNATAPVPQQFPMMPLAHNHPPQQQMSTQPVDGSILFPQQPQQLQQAFLPAPQLLPLPFQQQHPFPFSNGYAANGLSQLQQQQPSINFGAPQPLFPQHQPLQNANTVFSPPQQSPYVMTANQMTGQPIVYSGGMPQQQRQIVVITNPTQQNAQPLLPTNNGA